MYEKKIDFVPPSFTLLEPILLIIELSFFLLLLPSTSFSLLCRNTLFLYMPVLICIERLIHNRKFTWSLHKVLVYFLYDYQNISLFPLSLSKC